jgi:putative selenate reductase molybdopterin-binding subunit
MKIHFTLNGHNLETEVQPGELLTEVLRRLNCWSVKHGCETGECGSCSILLDDRLVPSCLLPAAHADGHRIETVEGLAQGTELHPTQAAFMETGAIQCGYCTPGMILATRSLLDKERHPTLEQARTALSAVLCRCTGYVKPVEAVLRAAAKLRGEPVPPLNDPPGEIYPLFTTPGEPPIPETPDGNHGVATATRLAQKISVQPTPGGSVVGVSTLKVDALRDTPPSATISLYQACCMAPCSPAHMRTHASVALTLPGRASCPVCMPS